MSNNATLVAVAIIFVVVLDIAWRASLRARRPAPKPRVLRKLSPVPPPARASLRPRLPSNRRGFGRVAAIVAVTVVALLTPAAAAPTSSWPPQLAAAARAVEPGSAMTVSGWGFPGFQEGHIRIDGAPGPVGKYFVRGNGTFDVTLLVPELSPGDHTLSANAPNMVAATMFTVSAPDAASPGETSGASGGPIATSGGTPGSTQVPSSTPPAATPAPTPPPTSPPTPQVTPAPTPLPSFGATSGDHLFLIVMENHSYQQTWNVPSGPYITSLGNAGALASNYFAITHPSLPNYLDLFGGSNYAITDDCSPSGGCHVNARNLGDSLDGAGKTWKGYFESMPSTCGMANSGQYAVRHNPFVYFDNIRLDAARCAAHVVQYTRLAADLASNSTTPNFVWITPNVCNDMHDCSVATGDRWLGNNVPPILASPACTVDRCLVMVVVDEDDGSQGNHVLAIFAGSAAQAGVVSATRHDHFGLLRTIETFFGLPTLTANDAAAAPMTELLR